MILIKITATCIEWLNANYGGGDRKHFSKITQKGRREDRRLIPKGI